MNDLVKDNKRTYWREQQRDYYANNPGAVEARRARYKAIYKTKLVKDPEGLSAARKAYRLANLERERANQKARYVKNREHDLAMNRKWRAANPGSWRKRRNFPEPTRPEPDACECCGRVLDKGLCLDHDHPTHTFRGWLCSQCNRAIGALGDSIEGLQQAIDYLKRWKQEIGR